MTERKTKEQLAQELDEKFERGEAMQGLERVDVKVRPNADSIYSMRFTRDEIALLRTVVEEEGIKLSEFIRRAVLDAAERRRKGGAEAVVRQVQQQVRELAETVRQL
jgi:hypothetical protein